MSDKTRTDALEIQPLETRQMLSTVQIFAAGQTGEEIFDLEIDGTVVATFANIGGDVDARQFETFVFETEADPGSIRVVFRNDDVNQVQDRNLLVDSIAVDGVRFESESNDVFSTGVWRAADGCSPGFRQSEFLACNGYLEFNVNRELPGITGSAGVIETGHVWQQVSFEELSAPVIILGTPSFSGSAPGVAQVRNVSSTGFESRFSEWRYADGLHAEETIDYLALDSGRFLADDGSIWETGTFDITGNGSFRGVEFLQSFESTPYLFLTVQTQNGSPVVVRADNVTRAGFDAAIFEEQQDRLTRHGAEVVGYLAIDPASESGVVTIGGQTLPYLLETGLVDDTPTELAGVEVFVQEEASADAETRHNAELVNALSLGSGFFAADIDYRGGDTASLRSIAPRFRFDLPEGFELETINTGVTPFSVGLEVIGPEKVLIAEETGQIHLIENGTLSEQPVLDLSGRISNLNSGNGSLSGFAIDPDFSNNGFIYVTYTTTLNGESFGRLERFQVDADNPTTISPDSGFILIGQNATDGLVADRFHNIGDIEFGSDGTLLLSWGDTASNDLLDPTQLRAQDLNIAAGKIFRVDPNTGLGLSSNPFFTGNANDIASRVWALGLRNGYRFTIDTSVGSSNAAAGNPGRIFIADVGRDRREEINLVTGGENLGWPYFEGSLSYHPDDPGIDHTLPLIEFAHPEARSVIGGTVYTGTTWPESYQGSFFVADFVEGWIRSFSLNDNGDLIQSEFATGIRGMTDMEFDPYTGDIYIVGRGRGAIFGAGDGLDGVYRISFTG